MLNNKRALVSGATGQDGRLMVDYLLENSYTVLGLSRNLNPKQIHPNFHHTFCDYKNKKQVFDLVSKFKPDEIYHFAANSFPGDSSSENLLIEDNVSSFLNLVTASIESAPHSRFFNASSAYIFKPQDKIYDLSAEILPSSPYGISKKICHQEAITLRHKHEYFIVNGILFNHESVYRDNRFVTVKIIKAAIDIKAKRKNVLELGNINVTRDWSHAKDFIPAIYQSLQKKEPTDFILSSGQPTSLKDFIHLVFHKLGITLEWHHDGNQYSAKDPASGITRVLSTESLIRKTDYTYLVGDNTYARQELNLKLTYSLEDIISELIRHYSQTA